MVRRSTPRKSLDDQAFPIRMRIDNKWSETGSIRWTAAEIWLRENIGAGHFAKHSDGARTAFYFRTPEAAKDFYEAFSELKLADYTDHTDHLRQLRRHAQLSDPAEQSANEWPIGIVRYGDLK